MDHIGAAAERQSVGGYAAGAIPDHDGTGGDGVVRGQCCGGRIVVGRGVVIADAEESGTQVSGEVCEPAQIESCFVETGAAGGAAHLEVRSTGVDDEIPAARGLEDSVAASHTVGPDGHRAIDGQRFACADFDLVRLVRIGVVQVRLDDQAAEDRAACRQVQCAGRRGTGSGAEVERAACVNGIVHACDERAVGHVEGQRVAAGLGRGGIECRAS